MILFDFWKIKEKHFDTSSDYIDLRDFNSGIFGS